MFETQAKNLRRYSPHGHRPRAHRPTVESQRLVVRFLVMVKRQSGRARRSCVRRASWEAVTVWKPPVLLSRGMILSAAPKRRKAPGREAGFFSPAHFEKRLRVWNLGLRNRGSLFACLLPAQTWGAIPSVRENLPDISNPKAVSEVSGHKKSSLTRNGRRSCRATPDEARLPDGPAARARHSGCASLR